MTATQHTPHNGSEHGSSSLSKPRTGIFPGSFDPFTNGHKTIVDEALQIFDVVVIAIGKNSTKKNLFTPEERQSMIKRCFERKRVEVQMFSGLIAEFVKSFENPTIVRGLRSETDFGYEMPMVAANKLLSGGVSTIFIPTDHENGYLSSSLVREIAAHKGDVRSFVPTAILDALQKKS